MIKKENALQPLSPIASLKQALPAVAMPQSCKPLVLESTVASPYAVTRDDLIRANQRVRIGEDTPREVIDVVAALGAAGFVSGDRTRKTGASVKIASSGMEITS